MFKNRKASGWKYHRRVTENGDKQSWNISFSAEKSEKNSSERVKLFFEHCQERPTVACVMCNRCLYQKCAKNFGQTKFWRCWVYLWNSN